MPRRTLFIKVYLCFILAVALVIAAQVGLDRLTDTGPPVDRLRSTLDLVLSTYGETALEYHLQRKTAERFTGHLETTAEVRIYRIDPAEERSLHLSMPPETALALRLARQTGKTAFHLSKESASMAMPFAGPDGSLHYVAGRMPRDAAGRGPAPFSFPWLRICLILAISGGVFYALTRYLTSPVVKMQRAARRLAGGELTVRVGREMGRRNDELAGLAHDFDRMAERVESLLAQQRQLLGDISHELRSPLTRLGVALEIAKRGAGTGETAALARIEAEAESLNELIGRLLTLTRLESGMGAIEMAPVDLERMVREIAGCADFEARGRNCAVLVVETRPTVVLGHEESLYRAVENIVRNAVRYTGDGTTVEVSLTHLSSGPEALAQIDVLDHGSGVPERELPHLFRPFYRVSGARERKTGGTGLGLAIAERALRLHYGSVVLSNAAGAGLRATIRLPLSPP